MSRLIAACCLLALLMSPFASWAQEVAARIIAVAGEVSVARASQRLDAAAGMEVFAGDTVNVGAAGSAQLRFTDEGIVALRSGTSFRIAEYAFRNPAAQRAFFELLKGGLRTVTGVIGQRDPEHYRLKTLHANVGVRGTGFSVLTCEASCANDDGTLAPDGTYGAVTEGRIAVTNQGGEVEFGVEEYFYVADFFTAPQALLGPPTFLVPKRARASAAQAAARGGAGASAASAAPTQAEASAEAPVSATLAAALPAVGFQASSASLPTALLAQGVFGGNAFYRTEGAIGAATGEIGIGVNYTLGLAGLTAALRDDSGRIYNIGTPGAGIPVTVIGNTATFSTTLNFADFPQSTGAFRCSTCGPGGTPGFATQIVINGTIVGNTATVTITLLGPGGTFTVTSPLPLSTPPNNLVGAMSMQRLGGGAEVRSAALWNVDVDGNGNLTRLGPIVGGPSARLGSATSTITGRAPDAGNLVWGRWSTGATITDFNFATFSSTVQSVWIVGENGNTLPPSLGTVVFTPVGFTSSGGNQVLNSASLTADFVNRSVAIDINATNVTAGNTFQMNGTTFVSNSTGRFSAGFVTVTCTGPCLANQAPAGAYAGFIAGSRAQGAGVVFTAGYAVPGIGVTGVIGMGRR